MREMTTLSLSTTECDDTELVEKSLAGDREAFGQIVTRYHSLVCALAYSATGSRARSEDLAQDAFVEAWGKLRDLRDPSRLCSWLCGITRNMIHGERRRLGRQPAHGATPLADSLELPSADPQPTAQAISNEEMGILWREVGRLPEIYREPLVLYYRDHKSVKHVAEALNLSPEAVMQRLSRGRQQLQERMLEFIESALLRSNPGPQFMHGVQAALPLLGITGPAIALGAAKGGVAAKTGLLGFLTVWIAPMLGFFAAIGMSWSEVTQASTKQERSFVVRWTIVLWLCVGLFLVAMPCVSSLVRLKGLDRRGDWLATAPMVALWFVFAMVSVSLIVFLIRGKTALRRQLIAEGFVKPSPTPPASLGKRIAVTAGFLTAVFWSLIFLAWQSGDRAVSLGITGVVFLLGAAPFLLMRHRPASMDETKAGNLYVSFCGLVFLAILNWRLDVWLAPIHHVDLGTMRQLLPMGIIHGLSCAAIAWTAALVFVTRPIDKP
ncbi:ECF RNA polymerase sigma factor SigW [mine drainage metagenome]|uniref:ECF RNA polymerase sigma factor SigW n=1 Tax=mine drainage metagenome TaxID=410659 RepID=A0A1J5RSX4_9ZZZZ